MNKSVQRDVVYQVLKGTVSHPSADWVYERAREIIPDISRGTVYRNLNDLVKCGKAIKVQGVFEKDRFDADTSPHTHLVCSECGSVIDFTPIANNLDITLGVVDGAYLSDYSLIYRGICPQCYKNKI